MASVRSAILLLLYIVLGMAILIAGQKIRLPFHTAVPIFILFLLLNLGINKFFRLRAIQKYWSLRKSWYFIPAMVTGAVLAFVPLGLSLIAGITTMSDITVNTRFSAAPLFITFIIVCWEELWFRGIILNYCVRNIPHVALSIIVGILFVLLHVLNPEIDLVKNGPALFTAGALLTLLYFYYNTIWVPVGLHFGNNYFGGMLTTASDGHIFFGTDGYVGTMVLLLLFVFYIAMYNKYRNTNLAHDEIPTGRTRNRTP